MKKILISGGNGEFAKELKRHNTKYEITSPSKEEMDVTNIDSLDYKVFSTQPDYFIHAGALTRPMFIHETNPDRSITNNIIGTSNVVLACMKYKVKLIYLSTDYVYPGVDGNYNEDDYWNDYKY